MMHKVWSSIEEVPYCFSRSSVKFRGHTALKIVEFDPNWAFSDCNSSLNSPMATKWCPNFEVAWKRCPIVFEVHPSNCKVTRLKISSNLTQIGRCRTGTLVWIHPWLRNDAQSLEVAWKRCPIVFQRHPSNCKVIRPKKSSILTQIRLIWTVTPVWIHQWLRNYAKSLK